MIQIHRMTATFGRLENETLTLTPGLNVFTAANEAGKSTWAAFLTAMFYGIDTSQRAAKGVLPAKTRFKPWSGKPMEGVMELTWNGRAITLQRQSEGRTPMGKFTAFDTTTGESLPFLTAENCGRTLLGMERGVFIRSSFIGQSALAVTQDPGLEQKLSALVTTGDETVSFTKTHDILNTWKNHVRHNKTGYLPETEAKLSSVEEKLETIRRYHKDDLSLHVRKQELTEQKETLLYIEKNLKAAESLKKQEQLRAAEAALREAEAAHEKAQAAASVLPAPEELKEIQNKVKQHSLLEELFRKSQKPTPPPEPEVPHVFRGLTVEEARQKVHDDIAYYQAMSYEPKWLQKATRGECITILVASIFAFFLSLFADIASKGMAVLLSGGLLALSTFIILRKKSYTNNHEAGQLRMEQYAPFSHDPYYLLSEYEQSLSLYNTQKETFLCMMEQHEENEKDVSQLHDGILSAVREFASNIYSLPDAVAALDTAQQMHRNTETAVQTLQHVRSTYNAVRAAVGDGVEVQAPAEDFSDRYSLPQIARSLAQTEQELHAIETTLAQHQGLIQSLGDPAALEAEKQQLSGSKAVLVQRNAALTLAMETLSQANAELRGRFSPQISQAAGNILSRMTKGRYDALRMEQDLTLHARQSGEAVTRELLALSGGTADQLYLALRLAICDLALEEGTPLVLDDALVFFDDDRLAQTMELLKEEAEKRQILLFSCQSREGKYLANAGL